MNYFVSKGERGDRTLYAGIQWGYFVQGVSGEGMPRSRTEEIAVGCGCGIFYFWRAEEAPDMRGSVWVSHWVNSR